MVDVQSFAAAWTPRILALLRIMAGLLFVEHGLAKLCAFPEGAFPGAPVAVASLIGVSAVLELFGGLLVTAGLFTRPVAFLLSGEMAVAYFLVHAPNSFFPILNHGEGAILFCFIFLYISAAGPGAWSADGALNRGRAPVQVG